MASMLSSFPDRSSFLMATARPISFTRPASITCAVPSPIMSRRPLPARRRLASIVRITGSTFAPLFDFSGGAPPIKLLRIPCRSSCRTICSSSTFTSSTADLTSRRSSSAGNFTQRSASRAKFSSTACCIGAARSRDARTSQTCLGDAKKARSRSVTSPSISPAGNRRPLSSADRRPVISGVETYQRR